VVAVASFKSSSRGSSIIIATPLALYVCTRSNSRHASVVLTSLFIRCN
jgi:hypothetical protein